MKKKFLTIAMAILCCAFLASCDKDKDPVIPENPDQPEQPENPEKPDKPQVPETKFTFELNLEENNLNVKIASSEAEAEYIAGILNEEEFTKIGGAAGLEKFAESQLKENAKILKGESANKYEKLYWFTNYYAYAVQVNKEGENYVSSKNNGVSEAVIAVRHYVEFTADQDCAPIGMSDNGRYVVGQSMESSYIYDLYKDELTYVEGAMLYDITDNGIAYGTNTAFQAVKCENGVVTPIAMPEECMEACIFAVSPDGKRAVGYMADMEYYFQPLVVENMNASFLEKGMGPDDAEVIASVCRGIGSNGVVAGYSITADYTEMSSFWNASDKFAVPGLDLMKEAFNEATGFYDLIVGNMFTYLSPNGKYMTSNYVVSDPEDVWTTYLYPYLFDTESQDLKLVDGSVCSDFDFTRVDGVTNSGLIFISDVDMGFATCPYVYSKEQNQITTFQDYCVSKGYKVEKDMVGSFIASSADEKIFLLGNLPQDTETYAGYTTIIYIF